MPKKAASVPSPWPALPKTEEAAKQLVAALTVTPPPAKPVPELSAKKIRALLKQRGKQGRVVAGWPSMVRWFQKELDRAAAAKKGAQILWGVYHDSGGQVRAFRRLVGQGGLKGLHAVAVELFAADGHWKGEATADQQGDTADLIKYAKTGDRAAWGRLRKSQQRDNYTAWKYGYLPQVMDLLTEARAGGQRLLACDMPTPLKRQIKKLSIQTRMRLREVHCGLAVTRSLHLVGVKEPRRVATLWGQGHVLPAGVPRFLPAGTRVMSVLVYGFRPGPHGPEQRLWRRVQLTHPVMFPLDEQATRLVVLLPGPKLGVRLDQARHPLTRPIMEARRGKVVVRGIGGWLHVGGESVRVNGPRHCGSPASVKLTPGDHTYVYEVNVVQERVVAGVIQLPPNSRAELELDPWQKAVQYTVFSHGTP